MATQGSSSDGASIGDVSQEPRFLRGLNETLQKFQQLKNGAFPENDENRILLLMPTYDEVPLHPDGQGPAWKELEENLRGHFEHVERLHYDCSFGLGSMAARRIGKSRGLVLVVNEPTWVAGIAGDSAKLQQHVEWAVKYAQDIPPYVFVWNPHTDGSEGPDRIVPVVMVLVGPRDGRLLARWTNLRWDTIIYSPYDRNLLGRIPDLIFNPDLWPANTLPSSSMTSSSEGDNVNSGADDAASS